MDVTYHRQLMLLQRTLPRPMWNTITASTGHPVCAQTDSGTRISSLSHCMARMTSSDTLTAKVDGNYPKAGPTDLQMKVIVQQPLQILE